MDKTITNTFTGDAVENITLDPSKEYQLKTVGTFDGTLTVSIPGGSTVLTRTTHFTTMISPGGNLIVQLASATSANFQLIFTEQD